MPDSAPVMRTTGVVTSWFLHVRRPGQIACLGCRDHTFWDVRPKIYETENGMSNPAMTVGWWRGRCPQGAAATDAQGTTDPRRRILGLAADLSGRLQEFRSPACHRLAHRHRSGLAPLRGPASGTARSAWQRPALACVRCVTLQHCAAGLTT